MLSKHAGQKFTNKGWMPGSALHHVAGGPAAIDNQATAVDIGGGIGGEEERALGDLAGLGRPAERRLLHEGGRLLMERAVRAVKQFARHVGQRRAGRDRAADAASGTGNDRDFAGKLCLYASNFNDREDGFTPTLSWTYRPSYLGGTVNCINSLGLQQSQPFRRHSGERRNPSLPVQHD